MTPDPSNRSNGRPPTLREIADQAGVHISTASRVLRQPEPADGWSDSALRVRQVAEELGYQRTCGRPAFVPARPPPSAS